MEPIRLPYLGECGVKDGEIEVGTRARGLSMVERDKPPLVTWPLALRPEQRHLLEGAEGCLCSNTPRLSLDQVWGERWGTSMKVVREGDRTPNQIHDPQMETRSPSPAKPSHPPFSNRDEARSSTRSAGLSV